MEVNRSSQNIVEDFLSVSPMNDPSTSFGQIFEKNPQLGRRRKYHPTTHPKSDIFDPTLIYELNCWNFRKMHDQFDDSSILTIGCSDTFGIGHIVEDTWAYKVGKELNRPVWNIGQPGGGIDTCFYNLQLFGDTMKYSTVFFLIPEAYRTYIWYTNSEIGYSERIQYTPSFRQAVDLKLGKTTVDPYDLTQGILFNDENILMTNITALHAIENYCKNKEVDLIYTFNPFAYTPTAEESKILKSYGPFGTARDNRHMGPKFQTAIADLMLKKYQEKL